jgi:hypothetical protein
LSAASSNEAELTIYVDGSCQDNQNVTPKTPAGWGAVIVTGDNQRGNGTGAVETEISGPVITDSSVDGFLGAEVGSNNTAEFGNGNAGGWDTGNLSIVAYIYNTITKEIVQVEEVHLNN